MMEKTKTEQETNTDDQICKLRAEIASLKGRLRGAAMWERDALYRRTLLEKLLLMEGFSSWQVFKIMLQMKKENKND